MRNAKLFWCPKFVVRWDMTVAARDSKKQKRKKEVQSREFHDMRKAQLHVTIKTWRRFTTNVHYCLWTRKHKCTRRCAKTWDKPATCFGIQNLFRVCCASGERLYQKPSKRKRCASLLGSRRKKYANVRYAKPVEVWLLDATQRYNGKRVIANRCATSLDSR